MRIGTRSQNDFMIALSKKNQEIQENFLEKIKELTKTVPTKVMLGDSTIDEQNTFDPAKVQDFYEKIIAKLNDWAVQNVSISHNEDLRRIFTKFEIREGNYLLSGHFSIQFHVLLYYKPDYKVIECQKELSEIMDKTKNDDSKVMEEGDVFILNKLKELGYKDLDHQNLFEIFFENDSLREKIYSEIKNSSDMDFQKLAERKSELFNLLDSYLMEIYQTSSVLIDDARLVAGEEGCLSTFDLEFIKNKTREGLFDPKKISDDIKQKIVNRLDQVNQLLMQQAL